MYKNQKGFTLIELLIVIVIIGILAGVLIAIIDPQTQQNRAKDAGVQASINKVALATQGFISAYGRIPAGDEFFGAIDNSTIVADCTAATDTCTFSVLGNTLPVTCTAPAGAGWNGDNVAGAGIQCNFRYIGTAATNQFQIIAKSFGIASATFRFDNTVGGMEQCDEDGASNCIVIN